MGVHDLLDGVARRHCAAAPLFPTRIDDRHERGRSVDRPANVPTAAPRLPAPTSKHEAGTLGRLESTRSVRSKAADLVGGLRGRHLLVLDIVGIAAAAYVALALRFEDVIEAGELFMRWLPILSVLVAARVAANVRFGLYSRRWRFASVPDLERIALPCSLDRSLPSRRLWRIRLPDVHVGRRLPAIVLAGRDADHRRRPRRHPVRDPGRIGLGAAVRARSRSPIAARRSSTAPAARAC